MLYMYVHYSYHSVCRAVVALMNHSEPDSPLNCDAGTFLCVMSSVRSLTVPSLRGFHHCASSFRFTTMRCVYELSADVSYPHSRVRLCLSCCVHAHPHHMSVPFRHCHRHMNHQQTSSAPAMFAASTASHECTRKCMRAKYDGKICNSIAIYIYIYIFPSLSHTVSSQNKCRLQRQARQEEERCRFWGALTPP